MPKGKGPGAPFGNKNAAGPHRSSRVSVVSEGKLIRHPNPGSVPKRATKADKLDRTFMALTADASVHIAGLKAKKSFKTHLKNFYKKSGHLSWIMGSPKLPSKRKNRRSSKGTANSQNVLREADLRGGVRK